VEEKGGDGFREKGTGEVGEGGCFGEDEGTPGKRGEDGGAEGELGGLTSNLPFFSFTIVFGGRGLCLACIYIYIYCFGVVLTRFNSDIYVYIFFFDTGSRTC
jgi:hypothetical protein